MNKTHLLAILGIFLAACGDPPAVVEEPTRDIRQIRGTVEFAERIGLTPESRLEVRLLDITMADEPAKEMASRMIDTPGQSPLSFTIDFDGALIDEGNAYSVEARIFDRGKLIMMSDTVYPVLTSGAGNEVTVTAVRVRSNDSGR